jgi:WD40 repeat protein
MSESAPMENLLALPTGTELVGDYRIERVLGAGGFGLTYLARDPTLDRAVTIKEYFPSDFAARDSTRAVQPKSAETKADYDWGLERFIEEAQTLARFDHPNINRVYRYFRANSTAYMVLHFEEGQSFKAWLAALGRAPRQAELDRILAPLLDALELIHGHDFLHRDIAPDNIIIRKDGAPVLIDFGSARGEMVQLSKTVSALVKPGYSPYEQYALTGRQQGPWTDIYSLGATLYQAVTSRRPTDAPTRIVADDYKPAAEAALSSYRPDFLSAIDKALALKVEERPQSIAAWRALLLPPEVLATRPAPAEIVPVRRAAKAEAKAARPGAAPKPARPPRTGLKRRLVRLLEGVASSGKPAAQKPAGKLAPPPAVPAPAEAVTAGQVAAPALPQAEARQAAKPKLEPRAKPAAVALGPVKPVPRRREVTPVGVSRKRRRPFRSLMVKLGIGVAVAAFLVSFQDRLAAFLPQGLVSQPVQLHTGVRPEASSVTRPAEPRREAAPRQSSERSTATSSVASRTGLAAEPDASQELILKGHRSAVTALGFTSDGAHLVSAGADGTLRLWDQKGRLARTVELGEGAPSAIAVHERQAVTAHQDGRLVLWDLDSGAKSKMLRRNEALIWSVAFAGEKDRIVSGGHDWAVTLWDGRKEAGPVHLFEGHENAVQAVAYSPKGPYIVSGGADKTVKLWNAADYALVRTFKGHRDFVSSVAVSPDGEVIASGSFDKTMRLWSPDDGSIRTLRGHKGRVTAVAFSPDSALVASASEDGTVRLWEWKRGRLVRTLAGHAGPVRAVAFSPDGKRLATAGEDGTIRVWDAALPGKQAARGREAKDASE